MPRLPPPVAERIAAKKGVHRDVKDDCVACHVEHAGVDAELRPFDPKKFDHHKETGFALDGGTRRSPPSARRATRSGRSCGAAGLRLLPRRRPQGSPRPDCATCHTTAVPFKDATKTFDHSKAAFQLTGAHATVKCATCHKTPDYRVPKFAACTDCHKEPARKPLGVCASCHTTESFKTTQRIDHDEDGLPADRQARHGRPAPPATSSRRRRST